MTKNLWAVHISRHTGCYLIKCNHCSRKFAKKPTNLKCSKINDFSKIAQPQFKKKEIMAYVCNLCNFVRFHKKEIQSHLNNEHDAEDVAKTFKEMQFLSFPFRKRKSKQESLDDFITMIESEYTDTENEIDNDEESEFDSEYNSDEEIEYDSEGECGIEQSKNEIDGKKEFFFSKLCC